MGKSPLVTVIVPVYNTAPYLKECFASISSQTYQRLEIIAVDDGSTDGSSELRTLISVQLEAAAKSLFRRELRLKCVCLKGNSSPGAFAINCFAENYLSLYDYAKI